MIVLIQGKLLKATPLTAVISAGGIGYAINIPVTTAEKLPQNGEEVILHTHAVYREDSQALYGFWNEDDRDFFALVVEKVSGVGPKVAISLMSKLPLSGLISAISTENATLLAKTPGIGKKTAERIIIELKDKLAHFRFAFGDGSISTSQENGPGDSRGASKSEDAILALQALGYKQLDANKVVSKVIDALGPNPSTEEIIKAALG